MKKVAIIGSPGAGKSTLAIELGRKLNLPVYHLDRYFHKPNWQRVSKDEWNKIQNDLINKDKWIIDGNYQGSLPLRIGAADTVILLNYPKPLCVYRAVKRLIIYKNKPRPDRAEGCDEKLDLNFFKFIITYPIQETLKLVEEHGTKKQVFILTSPQETRNFLKSL